MKRKDRTLVIKFSREEPLFRVRDIPAVEVVTICARCRHLQDGDTEWLSLEEFLRKKLKLQFRHRLCRRCSERINDQPWLNDKLSDL